MGVPSFNPNHPVVRGADDQWHKIAALLLAKLPGNKAHITADDLQELVGMFGVEMPVIVLNDRRDGLHVSLVPSSVGEKLAREAGGLPC